MKRRLADPLTPLLPVARVAVVGLVAAAGALIAVHAAASPAPAHPSPTAAVRKLVATPSNPQLKTALAPMTITDQAEITRVADIINALPPAPTGVFNCPVDWGARLRLDFESSDGKVVEQVSMEAGGCGGTEITLNGTKQPNRASGLDTIKQVEAVFGANWQFTPSFLH